MSKTVRNSFMALAAAAIVAVPVMGNADPLPAIIMLNSAPLKPAPAAAVPLQKEAPVAGAAARVDCAQGMIVSAAGIKLRPSTPEAVERLRQICLREGHKPGF